MKDKVSGQLEVVYSAFRPFSVVHRKPIKHKVSQNVCRSCECQNAIIFDTRKLKSLDYHIKM